MEFMERHNAKDRDRNNFPKGVIARSLRRSNLATLAGDCAEGLSDTKASQ